MSVHTYVYIRIVEQHFQLRFLYKIVRIDNQRNMGKNANIIITTRSTFRLFLGFPLACKILKYKCEFIDISFNQLHRSNNEERNINLDGL